LKSSIAHHTSCHTVTLANPRENTSMFWSVTDAWEQRKLGEVANIFSGGTPSRKCEDFWDGHIPWVTTAEVHYQPIAVTKEKITQLGLDNSAAKLLPIGTILMAMIGQGKTRGQVAVLEIEAATNQNNANIVVDENTSSHFVYFQLEGSYEKLRNLSSSAGQGSLNLDLIRRYKVSYVSDIQEQAAIGSFFATLDKLITLQQRKLEALQKLKQGYLQQLFPQEGETVPRVRFAGFEGDWEVRKLDEVSVKNSEKNKNNTYSETLTISAEFGIVNQRDFFEKDISIKKNINGYGVVKSNDFVYNPRISALAPVGPIRRNKLGRSGIMSPLYYVFELQNINPDYLEYYFLGANWHNFMWKNGNSGARSDRFAIKDSAFAEMPIPYPKLSEQAVIGNFFCTLDQVIVLQQSKIEQLQQLKKGYLQKMFM
ncbi:MAG: restriction endonuclease subunit S, partial [Coriobacteriia bacterium]|nr:restriction endonuclease subunit S [Coriobacteriia bacterium]